MPRKGFIDMVTKHFFLTARFSLFLFVLAEVFIYIF